MAKPKSRGNGEGSIYQRSDDRWCASVSIGYDSEGKLKRRTVYGKTRKEVADKLKKLHEDYGKGIPIEPSKLTVAQHFNNWMLERKLAVREGTWKRDGSHVNNHIIPGLGHIRLQKLHYKQVSQFYLDLADEKELAGRTIFDIATVLRAGLKDAVKKGLIPVSPAEQVPKPSYEEEEARFLNHDEVRRFFEAAQGAYLEELFILMVNTGLRPGEALGLAWDSIDLEKAQLTVRQALVEINGKVSLGDVKTRSALRTISLPAAAVAALKRQQTKQKRERLAAGEKWHNEHNLVFTHPEGGWLRRSYVGRTPLQTIVRRAGLKDVTLHTFRHTHASLLIDAGMRSKYICSRLGHANISITLDTYGHLMPDGDEKAAQAMDNIFSSLTV